jgi:uncharacterized protein YkwD
MIKNRKRLLLSLPILIIAVCTIVIIVGVFWFSSQNNPRFEGENVENVQKAEEIEKKPEPEPETTPKEKYVATKQELLDEVNRRRAEVGAAALQYSAALEQSAQAKCDDMITRSYWGHVDPDGKQGYQIAIDTLGLKGEYGENLSGNPIGYAGDMTAFGIFRSWFTSEPHKQVALSTKYTLTGFGLCGDTQKDVGENGQITHAAVEHFYGP